ncbi:MAG TPA: NAD-dependent epimerase/dehydratase family protein, partial [Bryobacteraceae bacterium]|nr:NAD-dependent epimerase/dehydratase family protein [Bryobacteraceae bacterium]
MRVLVLGGTSLTGPFLVRRLKALGHEVSVFHRGEHETELPEGVRHLHGDFHNPPRELRALAPDVVVHMWALTEADALRFVELFRGFAGRAVVISSCDVYAAYGRLQRLESGPPTAIPLAEDAPLRESRYPYRNRTGPVEIPDQYDKVLVEAALREQSGLPVTILRFPAVYGPHDYHRFRPWVQKLVPGNGEIKLQDDFARWRWTHGFVENVAEAVVLAATRDAAAGRTYNVGEAIAPSWAERLAEWGRVAGWHGRILGVPADALPENERMPQDFSHHLAIDTTRIRR